MVQRREDSGFSLEPGQAFRVIGEEVREDFQGHLAPELGVLGPIHLSHPAFAELGGDPEVGQRLADQSERILL